jgi:hypothetical protein
MSWLRRARRIWVLAGALALLGVLAQPEPSTAQANVACDLGSGAAGAVNGGVEAITGGAIGLGNPVGDACNAVSGAVGGAVKNPLSGALKGVGNGIFEQITAWVSEGASWLIGKVAKGINRSTSPKLTAKGFVATYRQMAQIAALLGAAMLLLAVMEGVAQGNAAMLARVILVNLPLAFIATSVAYIAVQLLLVVTDGLCHAIASASHDNSEQFFKQAIAGLGEAGGDVGRETSGGSPTGEAAGTVAVPLFVTFLAAIIGAFAAFLVWLELLMRDAAVYVVALFLPMALAASIWPRWTGALRRTGELLVAVIGSKFVIVSIIALAAGLLADTEGRVEPILAAAALMLLACFAPFVLLKLVPFAEGAMSAAYSRRGSGGGIVSGVQMASDVQILRNMARSNWGESGGGVTLWDAGEKGGGSGAGPKPGGKGGGPGAGGGGGGAGRSAGGGSAGGGGAAVGGAGAAGAAAAVPAAAVGGAKAAGRRAQGAAVPRDAGERSSTVPASETPKDTASSGSESGSTESPRAAEKPPRPAPESPGVKPERKGGKR